MINVENLTKDYQRVLRREGFLGSLRTLISAKYAVTRAVDGISFHIEEGELKACVCFVTYTRFLKFNSTTESQYAEKPSVTQPSNNSLGKSP